jgi:hypothetical protein
MVPVGNSGGLLRKLLLASIEVTATAAAPSLATDEDACTMSFRCTRW